MLTHLLAVLGPSGTALVRHAYYEASVLDIFSNTTLSLLVVILGLNLPESCQVQLRPVIKAWRLTPSPAMIHSKSIVCLSVEFNRFSFKFDCFEC